MFNDSLYGNYRQLKFSDIYNTFEKFSEDYTNLGIQGLISNESLKTIYYSLYANYGNSTIASSDINRFKFQLFDIIFQYGPTWEKRLDIQKKVRNLTDEEILTGSKAIYNKAYNPAELPSQNNEVTVDEADELNYINEQNVTKYKRNKLDAYSLVWNILRDDITKQFLNKFKKLFIVVVLPELPLWYVEGDN